MRLLYNVITPLRTHHPHSPSPALPVPLSSMITALPGASEFELGLPIISPPPPCDSNYLQICERSCEIQDVPLEVLCNSGGRWQGLHFEYAISAIRLKHSHR